MSFRKRLPLRRVAAITAAAALTAGCGLNSAPSPAPASPAPTSSVRAAVVVGNAVVPPVTPPVGVAPVDPLPPSHLVPRPDPNLPVYWLYQPAVISLSAADRAPQGAKVGFPAPDMTRTLPKWYGDGCRYFQDGGGQWWKDYCHKSASPSAGPVFAGVMHVWRPLPDPAHAEGFQIDWTRPGYIAVHDGRDPLFDFVKLAAWPLDSPSPGDDILYQVYIDGVQEAWYTMAELSGIFASGQGHRLGMPEAPIKSPWLLYLDYPSHPLATPDIALALEIRALVTEANCLLDRCPGR
jgi:hypothetical protein